MAKDKTTKKKGDSMGDRMKNYEAVNRHFLIPKLHTVLRLDGRAFHTYTKKFKSPFDDVLINAMDETAKYLCSKIQGAKFAYVQSDEITIYLSDNDELETQMWYGGNIQKMVSVSAAIATAKFNHIMLLQNIEDSIKYVDDWNSIPSRELKLRMEGIIAVHAKKMELAEFDSRVFQLPNIDEVLNCVLWRQQDCTRNSIQSVAHSLYSQNELHKQNTSQLQEMIFQKGINWNDYDPKLKRGRFIDKEYYKVDVKGIVNGEKVIKEKDAVRSRWVSVECPIFSQDREFLLSRIK
jgi:tRNA(His) guanylyltransferase